MKRIGDTITIPTISILIFCRNERGIFEGKVHSIFISTKKEELSLEDIYGYPNRKNNFDFSSKDKTFTLNGEIFRFIESRTWPGSWCGEEFFCVLEEANKLMAKVHEWKWEAEEGTDFIFDRYENFPSGPFFYQKS